MSLAQRDFGGISIGSVIRIFAPLPIEGYMSGDIPLLKTDYPAVLLQFPARLPTYEKNFRRTTNNNSSSFIFNLATVRSNYMDIKESF